MFGIWTETVHAREHLMNIVGTFRVQGLQRLQGLQGYLFPQTGGTTGTVGVDAGDCLTMTTRVPEPGIGRLAHVTLSSQISIFVLSFSSFLAVLSY